MIDHHRYADLLEATAQAGATYVQVGDDKQLSPVEAGGLWTVVHQMAEERGLATELETVRRARNPAEAQAWTDLRYGEVEKALNWYHDQGRLHLYESRAELLHGMVDHWWRTDAESVMVIDTTNLERDSANRLAQAKRLEAGELGLDVMTLANGREIRTGDRVLFAEKPTHLNRDLNSFGPRIENGTVATVRALQEVELDYRGTQLDSERGIKQNALIERRGYSQLDSERKHAAPGPPNVAIVELHEPVGSRVVAVDASVPLELAYARHVYKAQGMSTEVGNIATGPSTSRERGYVMTSRSREGTHIHAVASEIEENWETRVPDLEPVLEEQPVSTPLEAETQLTASQIIADIDTLKAERDAQAAAEWEQTRADATIREIARQAKSEAKQAIAADPESSEPAHWSQPDPRAASERQVGTGDRGDDTAWSNEFDSDFELNPRHQAQAQHDRTTSAVMRQQLNSDEIRANTRQRLAERMEANQEAVRQQGRVPAPMPAREAAETIARGHAERGNTTELLALYRTMDRLEMSQDPERAAVERAEPGSLIIAQDQAQRERLRGLLQERQQDQPSKVSEEISPERASRPEGQPEAKPEAKPGELPSVITAQDAYSQRAARREQWVQQTMEARQGQQGRSEAFQHHVEPGAIERATVVVSDPKDAHALSRGLSGAAQARLVTGQPDPVTAQAVHARASEIHAQQQTRAEQESQQQAEQVQEAQHQQAAQRTQEAQPAQAQPEHQGAER
ncbi:AAA family ATPase [Candidatus Nephthysia bennettiae]|uniref:AAA family ATPase n=1 Tax=Candidatus Nephthysia bennettiae TaxID=3127016 RepID=A0A934K961_9BACT|nr:AAA family ATPase [Candidatus Dormibacteraeota bacterium]MBJ7613683.1 AAA family ATPase [Candidatus Dormibacteraeota bacterium]